MITLSTVEYYISANCYLCISQANIHCLYIYIDEVLVVKQRFIFSKNFVFIKCNPIFSFNPILKVDSISISIVENEAECEQLLSNMGYNDRVRLSDMLDGNGIEVLMRKLLSAQDALDIWRACHGGHDPAMGLIFTLAQSKLTTLKEFREFASKANEDGPGKASKDGPGKAKRLLDIIEEYPGYFNETLDKLPFDLQAKIASEISANPHPSRERNQPLWKTIAGHADLSPQSIKNLDMPTLRAQHESMTMKFIEIVGQRYPEKKVSWLVKGLLAVNRRDILVDCKLFVHCREHCCKHLFTTNNQNT